MATSTVSKSFRVDTVQKVVEVISEAKTLTASDSGKLFILSAAEGAEIALPALYDGLHFRFKTGSAFATTDWTIVSSTDVIEGYAAVNYATVAASNENTISLVASAETIGDEIELVCDGTSWHVSGHGSAAGSITFTVA